MGFWGTSTFGRDADLRPLHTKTQIMAKNTILKVLPRFLKRKSNGLSPFQEDVINSFGREKIIFLNAPVGSGKSFIARKLLESKAYERTPIVFIYPTKVLMECQVSSLIKEIKKPGVRVWPIDELEKARINLLLYSTDSLVQYLKKTGNTIFENRSSLLMKLFSDLNWFSKFGAIVTSPEVIHLMKEKIYKEANRLLSFLQNSTFIFDEFHCYYGLQTFSDMVDFICEKLNGRIILLSATPIVDGNLQEILAKYDHKTIDFYEHSAGTRSDVCFNYNLDVEIDSFNYARLDLTMEKLIDVIPGIEKPAVIIFDSVFRLRHFKRLIGDNVKFNKCKFIEWSGMKKDYRPTLDNDTIVLGTSSIEVGIDMKFKSGIIEARYWPSAIQRIARVGRKADGNIILFARKDFSPFIKSDVYDRTDFEENLLKNVLSNPRESLSDGMSFRGTSYNFLIKDNDLNEFFCYNENLFAMYDIEDEYIDDWRGLTTQEKRDVLFDFGLNTDDKVNDLLLRDLIIPFWGVVKGHLKNSYEYLDHSDIEGPNKNRDELVIKGRVFYGG